MKYVTISNCTRVGVNLCDYSPSLEYVEFKDATPPTFDSAVMFQNVENFVIYVPDASLELYKSAQFLSDFASRIRPASEKTA